MTYLEVEGVNLSSYINEMTTDHEPIWNTKAGRTLDATFVGRIIGHKWKLSVGTRVLSQKESAIIHKAIKNKEFLTVKFIPTDSETDKLKAITCYVSVQSNKVYSYVNGLPRYSGMSFSLVEQ